MAQNEVWLRNYVITGNPGTGTESDPFDASTSDLFDALMRGFHDELGAPSYYIHLGTGTFLTDGGLVTAVGSLTKGWLMGNGWTIAGAGIGATTLRLNEFTTIPDPLNQGQGKRVVISSSSSEVVRNLVVRDMTIDADWENLAEKPTDGRTAVLSIGIYSQGNATVENVRSINTYGDGASGNECFAIFLGHRDEIDPIDAVVPSMLAIRNCIAEKGHGDYVVGMAAFAQRMVEMRGNVCRDLPNGRVGIAYPSSCFQFSGRGVTFTENKSHNCPGGLYFDTGNIYDVLIANNQFFDCQFAGIQTNPGSNFFAINVRQGGSGLDGQYVDVPVKLATESNTNYRVRVWMSLGGSSANEPPAPPVGHRVKVDYNQGDPIAGATGIEQKIADAFNADNPAGIGHLFSGSTVELGAVIGQLSGIASWAGNAGTCVFENGTCVAGNDYLYAQRGYEFQNWVIDNNLIEIELGYWSAQQYGILLAGTGAPACKDYTITNNYVRFTGTYGESGNNAPYCFVTAGIGGQLTVCENRSDNVPIVECCNAGLNQLPGSTHYFFGNRLISGSTAGKAIPGAEDSGVLLGSPKFATALGSENSPAIEWTGQQWAGSPTGSMPVSFRALVEGSV